MPDNDEFLALARKRFTAAAEEEKELREAFASDLRFASPDGEGQWDPQVKMQREQAGRPAMSFPRCHTFVQQVANEARQNKPQIKFAPRLDSDKDTAEIYEGLARFIQYDSDAQVAYETAVEYSAGASFGYWRFLTDYCDDESDDLDLKVVPVLDPLQIYGVLVPACFNRKPKFAFVIEDVPKEEYKLLYPDSELASLAWSEAERRGDGWIGENTVRIAEYWYVEEKQQAGKRKPKPIVKFCKTNGIEVLPDSETTWPGSTIPIIPVLGKQMIIEGKPRLFSVIRPQKDAQRLINYFKTRIAETASTAPISPFMVANGQISGFEAQWASLNTANTPFLTYNVVDSSGRPIPPPQRQTFEPPIQALSNATAQEIDDMKATTGIFDASLGNSANEVSGQAIMRRQQQANVANMHFLDNLERSFRKGGEVIAEVIPAIYDTARQIRILGEDEASKIVLINKAHTDANGKQRHYKMTEGKYDLVVTMGRAFSSKRMESFDMIQQVIQSNPQSFPMIADIFFKNSDMAGADTLAERFKKMLPPQLQSDEDQQIPPQAQAAISQLQQQGQALNAHAQILEKQLGQLQYEKQAKVTEHQLKMEELKLIESNKLAIAEVGAKTQEAQTRIQMEHEQWKILHGSAHDLAMQKDDQAHAQDMAQQQAEQAQQMQAQQAEQQAQQPAQGE
jgi:hypothetical protein